MSKWGERKKWSGGSGRSEVVKKEKRKKKKIVEGKLTLYKYARVKTSQRNC
jgi:hypothetical protein